MRRQPNHSEGNEKWCSSHRIQMASRTALDFWHKLNTDGFFYLAAILAYNLLMSIIPLLAVLLSLLTAVLGALDPHVQQQFFDEVGKLILPPSISSKLLQPAMQTASQGSDWVGFIALLVSAWFGSRLFVAIEHCFSMIFHVPKRAALRKNLMALLMLLVFALLLPLLLAVPLGLTLLSSKIAEQVLAAAASTRLWLTVTGLVASFVVAFVFFLVIYLVVPNRPLHMRDAWRGALIAGALLQLYNLAFPFYTTHFLPYANYGAAMGFTLLILLFFYYFGLILLLGAEINAFWASQRRTATDLADRLDQGQVHNQRGGEVCSTAGQPQEEVQTKSPGLNHAMTSEQKDEGQERKHVTKRNSR